jgi:hypothetical protein
MRRCVYAEMRVRASVRMRGRGEWAPSAVVDSDSYTIMTILSTLVHPTPTRSPNPHLFTLPPHAPASVAPTRCPRRR